ncbi:MAG TPA: FkbM family methyltransferase [Longimicrobium sp.]|nr:FkbM family methyltransferase [Longimicrobium sp.]
MNQKIREAGHALLRAALPPGRVELVGRTYRVAYESRRNTAERDYEALRELARGARCVFDVGANKGLTSLLMASVMGEGGEVVAFEASEASCAVVRENARLNGLEGRIRIVNAVVAERSGIMIDFFAEGTSAGSSIIEGYLGHRTGLARVTLAIDDYVAQTGKVPQLLKVDVEGAERRVIEGMRETLRRHGPAVQLELHTLPDRTLSENAADILPLLDEAGYRMVYLRTREDIRDVAVLGARGRCHVLLLPAGVPFPASLAPVDTTPL